MRDLFPGWIPPDEETLERYWSEATFAIDTSVLLDLYRFSEEARDGLIKALRSFGERLWIPHQVALEFHRNRLGVLLDQREAENNLLQELDGIRQDLDGQLSQLLRGAGRRDLAPLREAIDGGFDSLREKLKEAEQEHTKGLGESIRDDPIYEEVVELCGDRIGPPFDEKRQAEVIKDAEERFRTETPPGYLDNKKEEKTKYGDVILWHQLCQKAAETNRSVVLIADDQKADWVWEVRGKTIGPRPELVAEMNERTGVGFHLYTPRRLLQVWEKREEGREVEPGILAELEASSKEPALTDSILGVMANYIDAMRARKEGSAEGGDRFRTFHHVGRRSVDLFLECHWVSARARDPETLVTVVGPGGRMSLGLAHSVVTDDSRRSFSFFLKYPTQFPKAGGLQPGDYEVIWELLEEAEDPQDVLQEIGRDRFTITEV